ncbi:MAG: hypothetical protein AB8B69_20625 [Chitinophagales bacterium]
MRPIITTAILFMLISCSNQKMIEFRQVVGNYHQIEGAEDYNYLQLLEDSTFRLTHSQNFGDMMLYYFGKWRVNGGKIQLIQSANLEEYLDITEVRSQNSDSLILTIDRKLKDNIGSFNLKLEIDSTIWRSPENVIFRKSDYRNVIEKVYPHPELLDEKFDMNVLVDGLIWNQDYHLFIDYIFSNSILNLTLREKLPASKNDSTFIEYQLIEETLICSNKEGLIPHHHLVKEKLIPISEN